MYLHTCILANPGNLHVVASGVLRLCRVLGSLQNLLVRSREGMMD